MKLKQQLLGATSIILAALSVHGQQPYTPCLHPETLLEWSPETNPDAKFSRSSVPLAKRIKEPTLMKANANQYYEGQICNSTILFNMCGSSPAQGAANFTGYSPTYWQYMDKVVYWAGSAGEGIICPPPVYSIDAAHLNGVKILGNVFFPPSAFGGERAWVTETLTKDDTGHYPVAKKLYEMAKYMGFDGWFINEETGGGSEAQWVDFINDFYSYAKADGMDGMEIQWYDARRNPSINILKTHVNTSQFLEYGATVKAASYSESLGCTVEQAFSKLYNGVECARSGLTGWNDELNMAFPSSGHVGSLDLFCPEEHSWKDNVKDLLGTSKNVGADAYAAQMKTFQNEEIVWVNNSGDPTDLSGSRWRGVSGAKLENSVISSMPFVSNFSNGLGKYRFVEGEKRGTGDWWHTGVQSILPTWRWWIENKGDLKVSQNWDDAYNLGSSYTISGTLSNGDHLMRLYKTMIPVEGTFTLRIVYKANGGEIVPVIATESSVTDGQISLTKPVKSEKNGWTVADYKVDNLTGKTIYMLALNLKGTGAAFNATLGQIALLPEGKTSVAPGVTNIVNDGLITEDDAQLRLTWDFTPNADFDHFDIYTITSDGRTLVGQTRGYGFYVPKFARSGEDSSVAVEVVPVCYDGTEGAAGTASVDYPKQQAPVVKFKMMKSYAEVGETFTITASATGRPDSYAWELPEALELVSGEGTATITVKALAEGTHSVKVTATNGAGSTEKSGEVVDVFAKGGKGRVSNIAAGKKIDSYNVAHANNPVRYIIDGVTNPSNINSKWCAESGNDYWVVIDLQNEYRLNGIKIFDCQSGPESAANFPNYRVLISKDNKEWTEVLDERNVLGDNIKEAYWEPANARYVKFNPWADENFTLRVWEVEVYGYAATNMKVEIPAEIKANVSATSDIVVKYDMGGESRQENFACEVTVDNKLVSVGKITENTVDGTFTIPVTAGQAMGQSNVTVRLVNGAAYVESKVTVNVDCQASPNMLAGKTADVRFYNANYHPSLQGYDKNSTDFKSYAITGLTDGKTADDALSDLDHIGANKYELWTVFDNGAISWNLTKINVHIPYDNFAEKDNGVDDNIYSDIALFVWDDKNPDGWVVVKEFTKLGNVSELSYILPSATLTKKIAVAGNLLPNAYPALAEIEAYEENPDYCPNILAGLIPTGTGAGDDISNAARITDEDESTYGRLASSSGDYSIIFDTKNFYGIKSIEYKSDATFDKIEGSVDGETYTLIAKVDANNNGAINLGEEAVARYIRFSGSKEYGRQNIYEIRAYGKTYTGVVNLHPVYKLADIYKAAINETTEIEVPFDMDGEAYEDNFAFNATIADETVAKVEGVIVDRENHIVKIAVKGGAKKAKTNLTINAVNGTFKPVREAVLSVYDPESDNLIENRPATGRTWRSSSISSAKAGLLTDGDETTSINEYTYSDATAQFIFDLGGYYTVNSLESVAKMDDYDNVKDMLPTVYVSLDGEDWEQVASGKDFVSGAAAVNDAIAHYIRFDFACESYSQAYVYEVRAFGKPYDGTIEEKQYMSLELNGFNADVIAESASASEKTDNVLGAGGDSDSYVYYSTGFSQNGGLPADRKVGNGRYDYVLASYEGKNSARMGSSEAVSLIPVETETAAGARILGTSAGGTGKVNVVVEFEDATTEEFDISYDDWYGESGFCTGLGRVNRNSDATDQVGKFRLTEATVKFSEPKKPVKFTFTRKSSASTYPNIFAIVLSDSKGDRSGVSGIEDIKSDSEAEIEAIYNLNGIRVENPVAGYYIVRYTDGSVRKVLIK